MLTKKELTEVLYLSCVENYFLAWLNRYYDISKLYGTEFISLSKVFYDFSHGSTYENYIKNKRIQDFSEDYGLTMHEYYNCNVETAIELIKILDKDSLCLIRVNNNFFNNSKRLPLREDHYICIDKDFNYINQYPLSEGKLTINQIKEYHSGTIMIYKINNTNIILKDLITNEIINQNIEINNIPNNLGSLESAIGVLRINRKRLEQYYKVNIQISKLLHEEVRILDNLYFQCRLILLRKAKGFDIKEYIIPLIKLEYELIEELKKWKRN